MAIPVVHTSYQSLHSDQGNNPCGSGADAITGYRAACHHWRVQPAPPDADEVVESAPSDFQWTVGLIGMFVMDGSSPTGVLRTVHGLPKHPGLPGRPSPERGQVFGCAEDVAGIDIDTIALDETQFEITGEANAAGSFARHAEMLAGEGHCKINMVLRDS